MLEEFQKKASHMDFNFPHKEGTGFEKNLKHVTPLAKDLLSKMLIYKAEERISPKDALKHAYFRDLRERERGRKVVSPTEIREGDGDDEHRDDQLPPLRKKNPQIRQNPMRTRLRNNPSNKLLQPEKLNPYARKAPMVIYPRKKNPYKS